MTKYKEYFEKMLSENKDLFDNFRKLHDQYAIASNPDDLQDEFNKEGEKVMAVVHEWDNRLCSQSEKGGYGVFTGNLSEKFQQELKKEFPRIDHVGIIVKKFKLKKINL